MTFENFELDVTALQQLPESDPIEQDGIQFGGCLVSGISCLVVATNCFVIATGGGKKK
jgi:hypothetical protein